MNNKSIKRQILIQLQFRFSRRFAMYEVTATQVKLTEQAVEGKK
jgi:hypothetical protein